MKFKLALIVLCVSLKSHAIISIMTKDPLSTDTGVGMITSGLISEYWLPILTPAQKDVGLTAWGGDDSGYSINDSLKALELITQGANAQQVTDYIYKSRPHTDYRFSVMSKSGHVIDAFGPDCHFDEGCGSLVDPVRKIIVSGGGQELDVIQQTFARAQIIHDYRIEKFKKGLKVEPFSCYLATMLTVSQEFGAERFPLRTASITLDLASRTEIIRTFARSEYEVFIVPELKHKMKTDLKIKCR